MSSCSKDDNTTGIPEKETRKELIGVHLIKNDGDFPLSINRCFWDRDDQGTIIKYGQTGYPPKGSVEYSDNQISLNEPFDNFSNGPAVREDIIYLENDRIKKIYTSFLFTESDDYVYKPKTHHYVYDSEGYLIQMIHEFNGVYTEWFDITVENGNVSQVVDNTKKITYKYTYDTEEYIPMSDWAVLTPMILTSTGYYLILTDDIMGKKNKNNIVRVDLEYQPDHIYNYDYLYLTYEPEFDDGDNIIAIHHTGRLTSHSMDGSIPFDFDNIKTEFLYRTVEIEQPAE